MYTFRFHYQNSAGTYDSTNGFKEVEPAIQLAKKSLAQHLELHGDEMGRTIKYYDPTGRIPFRALVVTMTAEAGMVQDQFCVELECPPSFA